MAEKNRKSVRLQHELLVAYRTIAGFTTEWAVNISDGGLFVNTRSPLPVGSIVKLSVSLPDATFPCDLTGKVMRVHPFDPGGPRGQNPGMGIQFIDLDEEKRKRLERFVNKLNAEL